MKIVSFAAAIVAAALLAAPALANSSPVPGGSNGVGTIQGGKNNTTQQYKESYTDPFFGPVSCSGVHQAGKNTTLLGNDSFTCTSTTGLPLANTYPGETLNLGVFGGWYSDFYNLLGTTVYATSFNGAVSLDGMSETAVANY